MTLGHVAHCYCLSAWQCDVERIRMAGYLPPARQKSKEHCNNVFFFLWVAPHLLLLYVCNVCRDPYPSFRLLLFFLSFLSLEYITYNGTVLKYDMYFFLPRQPRIINYFCPQPSLFFFISASSTKKKKKKRKWTNLQYIRCHLDSSRGYLYFIAKAATPPLASLAPRHCNYIRNISFGFEHSTYAYV